MPRDAQPVLIGVAQATWRERGSAGTPIDALEAVARTALADCACPAVAASVDAIVHMPFIMNQVEGLRDAMPKAAGAALAARLGITARQYSADVGGNLPQQLLNTMADRVVAGDDSVVLLCGVELLATFLGSVRSGEGMPDWKGDEGSGDVRFLIETPVMTAPSERAHGLYEPINAYPLFESALRHAHALSAREHAERLGGLISRMSTVAANNPHAWKPKTLSSAEVVSTAGGNRMISHPYTKVMNSVIAVDQAAAVVLTTAAKARELGVDEERWVYLRGAASANDTWFLSERKAMNRSPALQESAQAALAQARVGVGEIECFDLYSCFPSAVQVASEALGLAVDDPRGLTLTGGMSLFGGPGNNYSLHAIAEAVTRLRSGAQGTALVSANGGYLTKHSVGVYAREAPTTAWSPADSARIQADVDTERGPDLAEEGAGDLTVVAHTVTYSGADPTAAILLGELGDGRRCVARSEDRAVIEQCLALDCVGFTGIVTHRDGLNHFSF